MSIFEVCKGNKNKEFNFIFCFKTKSLLADYSDFKYIDNAKKNVSTVEKKEKK